MNYQNIHRIHRVTALILFAAIVFYLFFQVNKRAPFVETNPFAVDPYDAVGSMAIQVALLIGLLSYARTLRWHDDPSQETKARLSLRGDTLVLVAIFITLCADMIAEIVQPMPPSYWGEVLRIELGLMSLLAIVSALALWVVFRRTPTAPPPSDLTPADAIDDLWSLARIPVVRAGTIFPPTWVEWVKRFNSDRLFARLLWVDPRQHPWRFACLVGLLVGIGLTLAKLQEGLPPSLITALLLAGIFILVEFAATLVGFAIFGEYLGLRPAFKKKPTLV
jgi:hypothetical protein